MMEALLHPTPSTKWSAPRLRPPSLRIDKVEVAFGNDLQKKMAIKHFEAAPGEKILIHGPSGHGKTTLLHLLAGLLEPDTGTVYFDESDIFQLSESKRSRLRRSNCGVVFQTLNLLDHLTAVENVYLSLGQGSLANERAHAALKSVGMVDYANTLTANLSLGQKQRVAVARVLATSPRVLLADEPTSSLDDVNAKAIMELLLQASQNATLVMVSHDVRIRHYFTKVYEIGEIVQS